MSFTGQVLGKKFYFETIPGVVTTLKSAYGFYYHEGPNDPALKAILFICDSPGGVPGGYKSFQAEGNAFIEVNQKLVRVVLGQVGNLNTLDRVTRVTMKEFAGDLEDPLVVGLNETVKIQARTIASLKKEKTHNHSLCNAKLQGVEGSLKSVKAETVQDRKAFEDRLAERTRERDHYKQLSEATTSSKILDLKNKNRDLGFENKALRTQIDKIKTSLGF